MVLDASTLATFAVGVLVALVGYLLKRSIDALDRQMIAVGVKVDTLSIKDGEMSIRLAELGVRLSNVEAQVLALQRVQRRHRTGEFERPDRTGDDE